MTFCWEFHCLYEFLLWTIFWMLFDVLFACAFGIYAIMRIFRQNLTWRLLGTRKVRKISQQPLLAPSPIRQKKTTRDVWGSCLSNWRRPLRDFGELLRWELQQPSRWRLVLAIEVNRLTRDHRQGMKDQSILWFSQLKQGETLENHLPLPQTASNSIGLLVNQAPVNNSI